MKIAIAGLLLSLMSGCAYGGAGTWTPAEDAGTDAQEEDLPIVGYSMGEVPVPGCDSGCDTMGGGPPINQPGSTPNRGAVSQGQPPPPAQPQ